MRSSGMTESARNESAPKGSDSGQPNWRVAARKLRERPGYFASRRGGEQAGDRQWQLALDTSVRHDDPASPQSCYGRRASLHVAGIRPGHDEVMRIVGDGRSNRRMLLKAEAADKAESHPTRGAMAFDTRHQHHIPLRIEQPLAVLDANVASFAASYDLTVRHGDDGAGSLSRAKHEIVVRERLDAHRILGGDRRRPFGTQVIAVTGNDCAVVDDDGREGRFPV